MNTNGHVRKNVQDAFKIMKKMYNHVKNLNLNCRDWIDVTKRLQIIDCDWNRLNKKTPIQFQLCFIIYHFLITRTNYWLITNGRFQLETDKRNRFKFCFLINANFENDLIEIQLIQLK